MTDALVEEMTAWQARPLEPVYPVLLIDAIYLKVRDGQVANRPVYVAMGITVDGNGRVSGTSWGSGSDPPAVKARGTGRPCSPS